MSFKVAVDARPLSIPTSGIGRYCEEVLKRLLAVNNDIHWYLYSDRPLLPSWLSDGGAVVTVRTGTLRKRALSSLYAQWVFPVWAKRDGVNAFWSPRHHLPIWLPPDVKTIVTIHDLVWKRCPQTMKPLGRTLERLLMPASLAKADSIMAVSDATKNDIQSFYPELKSKISVTPLAGMLNTKCRIGIENGNRIEDPYFLFVGTSEPRKNLKRILLAFSRILKMNVSVRRLIICGGRGWGGEDIQALIESLEIADNTKITGFVDESELERLYRNAHALIFPSLYEGFGLPILEAMSFGVPVVTSNCSSMPEVSGDGALLVNPHSVEEIFTAMLRLATDSELYEALSAASLENVKNFSWEKTAMKVQEVISGLASVYE